MQALVRLYREARRRKVFHTAALYIVGAWLALQVANVSFPGFGIPDAAIGALIWAAVAGFPVARVFGWLFEVGPWGIRRTAPTDAAALAEPQPLGRRDYLILVALVAIAGVLVVHAVRGIQETSVENSLEAAADGVRDDDQRLPNSIAVLPFANISNDPDNEYFCDGVSEEILNALSGFRELNVIGRTSSFAFKGSDVGIDRISTVLGVRHVLQGSVRKAGGQLRIAAQLLDENGRQVWTETFDREVANIFEIQSEIATAVAARVASQVVSRPDAARHPNLDAYDHYLAGRELLHNRQTQLALEELRRAIEIDPDFAEAHAEWAISRLMGQVSPETLDAAGVAIERALAIRPQLLRAQAARALALLQSNPSDPAAAETILRSVLAQDPNMSDALLWLGNSLMAQDRSDEALSVMQRAARIDPLHPSIAINLADELQRRGEVDGAIGVLERQLEHPHVGVGSFTRLRDFYRRLGRLVELNAVAKAQALRVGFHHYSLALSYGLLGDWQTADYWLGRQMRDFPEFRLGPYSPAVAPEWRGHSDEALRKFRQTREKMGTDPTGDGLFIETWYGALLARAGEHDEAIEVLKPLLEPDAPLAALQGPDPQLDGQHALAWSYLKTGATAKADVLLTGLWRRCQSEEAEIAHDGDLVHYCAETALLRGEVDEALTWLARAVSVGWRDYYLRERDPYWAVVRDDPRYRELMAKVKADVDRQATEIQRIDARENFVAKLDAAMAARSGGRSP